MDRRTLTVALTALMLAIMVASPSTASAPMMQEQGSSNGQPDHINNTMFLFAEQSLTPCWSKFNNSDEDGAAYGEKRASSGTLNLDLTCRMDPALEDDIKLAEGEMIVMHFEVELEGAWTNGQDEECAGDCENLNVSLIKGNRVVATMEFDNLNDGANMVHWELPVTEDLVPWNGSQENFAIQFTMVIKAIQGGIFGIGDEDAMFGMYFAHPDNAEGYNASVTFPILNESATADLDPEVDDEGGDTPGFTAMIGVGGLAAAALLRPKKSEEDE